MAENDSDSINLNASEGRHFEFQRVYIKDLSFEVPSAPEVFRQELGIPKIKHHIQSFAKNLDDDLYEVSMSLTVSAKTTDEDRVIYLVEVVQAGIFVIKGYVQQERRYMIRSYCPNLLFPFAREVVAGMIQRGSFPQLILPPINFDALYNEYERQQEQQESGMQANDI